jgi:hypothetical protein
MQEIIAFGILAFDAVVGGILVIGLFKNLWTRLAIICLIGILFLAPVIYTIWTILQSEIIQFY